MLLNKIEAIYLYGNEITTGSPMFEKVECRSISGFLGRDSCIRLRQKNYHR